MRGELLSKTGMITQLLAEILRKGLCRILLQATTSWVVYGNCSRIEWKTEKCIFLPKVLTRADTTRQSLSKGGSFGGSTYLHPSTLLRDVDRQAYTCYRDIKRWEM